MKHIDLFSGIGGFALAARWTWGEEYENVGHSEIEKYPCKVYHRHFPESECLGDITKINWQEGQADLITGGFPCQPHSVAGRRKGSQDKRDLWRECIRALSGVRPYYAIFENVPGIITSEYGRTWERIKMDLEASGYEGLPLLLSAADVGAKHRRTRVWIVAHTKGDLWRAQRNEIDNASDRTGDCLANPIGDRPQGRRQDGGFTGSIGLRCGARGNEEQNILNPSIAGLPDWSGGETGQPWPITEFERPDGEANEIAADPKSNGRRRGGGTKNKRKTDRGLDTSDDTSKGVGRITKRREVERNFRGVAHGVSRRVDRLRGLGNSVVPQVVGVVLNAIKQHECSKHFA